MRVQNERSSVGKIVPSAVRANTAASDHRGAVHHHRHDIGEDIAALDEHWVFRKAR
ncbi:hypothetical protein WG901_02930 [Novosphingobium sp. PS1R-30]|uniref:Uncharacterized protein n=1 Tax=Novosphingobium anseongense TaxID=3133436 RepID=A0ABU8RRY9_9SPHN